MERNDCAIVRDLIPMYGEDLLSEETRDYMRDHIEYCGECRKPIYFGRCKGRKQPEWFAKRYLYNQARWHSEKSDEISLDCIE